MEKSVATFCHGDLPNQFIQISGLQVTFDTRNQTNNRVVKLLAAEIDATKPSQILYKSVDVKRNYTMVTSSYLLAGGAGYTMIREESSLIHDDNGNAGDLEILLAYMKGRSPVKPKIDGRIKFLRPEYWFCYNAGETRTISALVILICCLFSLRVF